MLPFIRSGDSVMISHTNGISNGDIITVINQHNTVLTHRVIDQEQLITKGDNNIVSEKSLRHQPHVFLGKVELIIRPNGTKIKPHIYSGLIYKYSILEDFFFNKLLFFLPSKKLCHGIKSITYGLFISVLKLVSWKR